MILGGTIPWTPCPRFRRLNELRWTIGVVTALLWMWSYFSDAFSDSLRTWTLVAALITVQIFGVSSSALLMMHPRASNIERLTNWYAIVVSVMIWVMGLGAATWFGITPLQSALLLVAVATGVFWLFLLWCGLQINRRASTARE